MNRSRITGDLAAHGILFADIANDRVGIGSTIPGNKLSLPDSAKIGLGNAEDLTLYHNGSHSWIKNNTGYLHINASTVELKNAADNETTLKAIQNGAVELYHNNEQKIKTTTTGAQIDTILTCYGAAGNPGRLRLQEGGALSEIMVARNSDTNSFLYFKTEISGTTATRVVIDESGHFRPFADSTYDLGITGTRWRNVYADTLYGSGANLTALNIVTDTSPQLGGTLDVNGQVVSFDDASGVNVNRAKFGTDNDMHIYHNGSNSTIRHEGTGSLLLNTTTGSIQMLHNSENMLIAVPDGEVKLYHNNSKKLETTSSGVSITGTLTTQHLTVSTGDFTSTRTDTDFSFVQSVAADNNSRGFTFQKAGGGNIAGVFRVSSAQALQSASGYAVATTTVIDSSRNISNVGTITASGILSLTSSSAYPLTINGSNDGKIVLRGSSNPYITFRESNTDKGYLQWHSDGYLKFKNHEDASSIRIKDTIDFSTDDSTWHTVWHAGNDGTGSGLDADLLDGVQGSNFLRSNTADSMSAKLTLNQDNDDEKLVLAGTNDPYIRWQEGTTNKAYIQWNASGYLELRNQEDSSKILLRDDIVFSSDGSTLRKIWHAGNDGAGSGLDADTLDGISSGSFLRSDSGSGTTNTYDGGLYITGGSGNHTNDAVFSVNKTSNSDWCASFDCTTSSSTDHGIIIRAESGSSYALSVYDGSNHQITFTGVGGINSKTLNLTDSGSYPLNINGTNDAKIILQGSSNPYIRFAEGSTNKAYLQWHSDGHIYLWNQEQSTGLRLGSQPEFYDGSYRTMWHANNDGAGSGLDADTVDGFATGQGGGANKVLVSGSNGYLYLDNWMRVSNGAGLFAVGGAHFYNGGASTWKSWINQSTHSSASGIGMRDSGGNDRGWAYADNAHVGLLNGGGTWLLKCPIGNVDNPKTGSGYSIWHQNNDGAGSGLDADTLDGVQLDSIVRHNQNTNYILRFGSGTNTGHTRSSYAYAIFQEGGGWGGQYPDLCISYHTGIKIGCGHHTYAGLRFTPDYNDETVLMGINDGITGGGDGQNNVFIANKLLIGGKFDNNSYNSVSSTRLLFGGGNDQNNYFIGTNLEDYGGNYTKLDLRWHTGIRMGAQSGYGGIRFYSNEDLDDLKFSIMGGGNHVKCYTDFLPGNSTSDIGNASNRWRNIYTSDLSLSNEAIEGGNDVDGTWGDWTLQEGEEDIYMINNRTGKKYAMMLREVS